MELQLQLMRTISYLSSSCLRQAAAAEKCIASAVMLCSMSYELSETMMHYLKSLANVMRTPPRVCRTLKEPGSFHSTTRNDWEGFMLYSLRREGALKEKSAWRLSNFIFEAAVKSI